MKDDASTIVDTSGQETAVEERLSDNALAVFRRRYVRKGPDGEPVETVEGVFRRVASHVAAVEEDLSGDPAEAEGIFFDLTTCLRFLPNSPTFTGAGTPLGQLAACFVMPISDDMGRERDGIFQTLRDMALIQQTGGGTGFSFSRLRPKGAIVHSSGGEATGPVGFMKVYDTASEIISQGGSRRGANMGVLRVDHPDIHEFITCKTSEGDISNFNISVGVTDDFMRAVEEDEAIDLINPQDGEVWDTVAAREIFDEIVEGAHRNGEPGMLFLDAANRDNPTPHLGEYEACNPCVTGDTLVAVADGRGAVPIRELAEAGQDVPVYCQGPDGIVIQWGRNPRKTRTEVPVFEVELDDGSTIRATADHKFMLRDGSYKLLSELQPGDSLMPFNKYHYGKGELQRYWAVYLNQPDNNVAWAPEHRMIIEFATGEKIRYSICCHETVRQRFGGFRKVRAALKETLDLYNHEVVDIRLVGKADVYNITVDDHHNYACVTSPDSETRFSGLRMTGVIAKNCGEQFLLPYENCCLGAINLARHVKPTGSSQRLAVSGGEADDELSAIGHRLTAKMVDWEKLAQTVERSVRFLDDVIEANGYVPAVPQLEEAARRTRRIGLGIMGLGDLLYQLRVRYGSEEAQELAAQVMEFIRYHAMRTSVELAKERGPFPAIEGSVYDPDDVRWTPPEPLEPYERLEQWGRPPLDWDAIVEGVEAHGIRNATQTTVAPTGTRSTVAGCEGYGCEPVFALAYVRHMNDSGEDVELRYASPLFQQALEEAGLDGETREQIIEQVAETGSCQDVEEVPEPIREVFVVAQDIPAEEHVRMQAALQTFVDASISKTINCPPDATPDDVAHAFRLAWELGCKGLTVYVTGSREKEVLETEETRKRERSAAVRAMSTKVRPRPHTLEGRTYRLKTPLGTAYTTVNVNGDDEPFEVFLNVGKAGSDTAAVAEAIGRLISLMLRVPSPLSATRRLKQVVRQLKGIGGGRPLGLGQDRVRSLPDGVAQVLAEHLGLAEAPGKGETSEQLPLFPEGDLCPECGQATLVYEEGCRHCYTCGYSDC